LVLLTYSEYLHSHQALQTAGLKPFSFALYWSRLSEEQASFQLLIFGQSPSIRLNITVLS